MINVTLVDGTTQHDDAVRVAVLHSYGVLDTTCEKSFDSIAELARRFLAAPIALISLVDAKRQWFKAHIGLNVQQTPRDVAFCSHAIQNPAQPMLVADATRDRRFASNPLVLGAPYIRSYVGIPLVNPQGYALGTLCVIDTKPRDFEAEQIETLTVPAQSVVTTLELRRALATIRDIALSDSLRTHPKSSDSG